MSYPKTVLVTRHNPIGMRWPHYRVTNLRENKIVAVSPDKHDIQVMFPYALMWDKMGLSLVPFE